MLDLIPIMYASVGLAGVVGALLVTRHPFQELHEARVYRPRHRATGESTAQLVLRLAREYYARATVEAAELLAGLGDASGDQKELDTPGPVKGSYAKLRTEDLDSTAERFYRLVEHGIRPPSPWGTPEEPDEWDLPEGVAGYAIAGGTR